MKKHLHIALLSISFWLLLLHSVVPHHHFSQVGIATIEQDCSFDQQNDIVRFFQTIFHTNVGVDHLEHLVEAASNAMWLLAALLLVAFLFLNVLVPFVEELIVASEVNAHERPLSPSLVYWQQRHLHLPPPARS